MGGGIQVPHYPYVEALQERVETSRLESDVRNPLFVYTDPLGDALRLVYNSPYAARATTTLSIGLYSPGLPNLNQLDDVSFAALVAVCPNLRVLHLRACGFKSVQRRLLSRFSLSMLTLLSIGSGATLTAAGLFGLLSMTPVLKRLGIGRVDCYHDSGPGWKTNRVRREDYAIPACSLTHLVVNDDQGINFSKYAHLLSRSYDTLVHFEMHWVFGEWVTDTVAAALSRCTRLRHLTLIGNSLPHERIIAACPTVSSLTLLHVPYDQEFAAMRALEVVNCYGARSEEFLEAAWKRLRERLPTMPLLSSIMFSLMWRSLGPETEGVQQLFRACRERRIRVSLHREMAGVGLEP